VTPNEGYVLTNVPANWTLNADGSASRTFTVMGAIGFQSTDPNAPCYQAPPPPDDDLTPGLIASQCVGAVPYLGYSVTLPEGFVADSSTPLTVTFVHPTDSSQNYVVTGLPLSGTLLWPGARATAPQQWPGWVQLADGTYVETDGNYAWTRAAAGVTVRFDVNPTYVTTVFYPPESSVCANPVNPAPASVPGTGTSALPATGGSDMAPWGIGAALMLIAGVMLVTMRRLARH
jgi:LPXTG-motif cell wall-anchored protein